MHEYQKQDTPLSPEENGKQDTPLSPEENGKRETPEQTKPDISALAEACAGGGDGLRNVHDVFQNLEEPSNLESASSALADAVLRLERQAEQEDGGHRQGGGTHGKARLGRRWYVLWFAFAAEAEPWDGGDYWTLLAGIYDGLREADCAKLCTAAMPFLAKARKDKDRGKRTLHQLGEILLETCQQYDASVPGGAPLDFWLLLGEAVRGKKRWAYCFNIFDKADRMHAASAGVNAKVLTLPSADVFHGSVLLQEEKYKGIQEAAISYKRNGSRKEIITGWLKEMKFIPSR